MKQKSEFRENSIQESIEIDLMFGWKMENHHSVNYKVIVRGFRAS